MAAMAYLLVTKQYAYALLLAPVLIYEIFELYRFQKKTHDELEHFLQSMHYRDFSRHFDAKKGDSEVRVLRKGFNEINATFKSITKEKEVQYQYLQKILELVNTGILSYKEIDGGIVWMNDSLRKTLDIPYLKTIHSLEKRNLALYQEITELKPGKSKVIPLGATNKVLLTSTSFYTDGTHFKVLAIQNVNEALDENEVQSWQKLLRVLTHEIMNSVAPISSLADTLKKRIKQPESPELIKDIEQGIDTIKKRSEGLIRFAETYRNLNKITSINKNQVLVRDLFENVSRLMQPTLEQKEIQLDIILKNPGLSIDADISLMEQVIINLVINAIEAVKNSNKPLITLSAVRGVDRNIIKVTDNGSGMPEEILDKVFVPFFSTRKKGSGIGLSICKQIILLHGGTIYARSKEGEGSVFVVEV